MLLEGKRTARRLEVDALADHDHSLSRHFRGDERSKIKLSRGFRA
jgi:hypothetical protein